jgi:hypothetical protein
MSLNNATVRLVSGSKITAKVKSETGQIQPTSNVTLKTTAISALERLDQLSDVVETEPQDGYSLVYRSSDDKYVVAPITLENVSGSLDGGTF